MFCLSCKYIPESPIKECIDAIKKFHPNEKILISDSHSNDISYFEWFSDYENVEIHEKNDNRQVGSLWESYRRYPNEPHYVLIQDTLILKKSISKYIDSDSLFISFMYFEENLKGFESPEYQFHKKVLDSTEYINPEPYEKIYTSFGPLFIAKNLILKNFEKKGLLAKLNTANHFEQQCAERIFGICAEQEGYRLDKNNIEGNYLERYGDVVSDNIKTFKKYFLMSKGFRLD